MTNDLNAEQPLSTEAILAGLNTRYVGRHVVYWPTTDSTNDQLKIMAEAGAVEGTLAIADHQLAGRGRIDRRWEAPAGSSLLMSLLFRPSFLDPSLAQQLTMISSLAAADAVQLITGLEIGLKWPNDLVLSGKKLAGVLTELGFGPTAGSQASSSRGDVPAGWDQLAWSVVGIGINVNVDFSDQPELEPIAISLAMALGHPIPRLYLLQRFLEAVEARYDALRGGISPHREWAQRLVTLGQPVLVTAADQVYEGVAENVDRFGALLLRRPDGELMRVLAGDVSLRRA